MAARFLDARSVSKLSGVNPVLVQLVHEAFNLSEVPFIVTEGVRSNERQSYLFASGKSKTLLSKHINGEAVDIAAIVDGKVNWSYENYIPISQAFKRAAAAAGVRLIWGGDWERLLDCCHFELAKSQPHS